MNGYASEASASTFVTVGTGSTVVRPAAGGRQELTLVNDHATQVVYLALQTQPGVPPTAVAGSGIRLNPAGGSYTTHIFRGAIAGISVGGASNVTVAEV